MDTSNAIQIDVIIPVLNEQEYIFSCLNSVCSFVIPENARLQIFVIDGCSQDETLRIALEFAADKDKQISELQKLRDQAVEVEKLQATTFIAQEEKAKISEEMAGVKDLYSNTQEELQQTHTQLRALLKENKARRQKYSCRGNRNLWKTK